ncbi:Intraflagellar transport protein 43, partial [Biomphalaria glabrata]
RRIIIQYSSSAKCGRRAAQATSSQPAQATSSQPAQATSSQPAQATSSQPAQATTTSSQPAQATSSQPAQATSSQPAQATSSQPAQATSSQPAQATSSQPAQATSSQPAQATSSQPAQATSSQPAPVLDEVELSSEPASKKCTTEGRLNKTVSGWGAETPARKPRARQLGKGFESHEDDRLNQKATDKDDDYDSDIPIIPELEETVEEDLSAKVASAPNVAVNREATYRELDNDLLKTSCISNSGQ